MPSNVEFKDMGIGKHIHFPAATKGYPVLYYCLIEYDLYKNKTQLEIESFLLRVDILNKKQRELLLNREHSLTG